jgi:hypothetical protein
MHDPLGLRVPYFSQGANNVLAPALNAKNPPALQAASHAQRRRLERLRMRAEPGAQNAITSHTPIRTSGYGFDLRQLWHEFILEN